MYYVSVVLNLFLITSMYFFSLLPILPIKPELNKEDNLKYNLELDQMTLIPKMIIVQD